MRQQKYMRILMKSRISPNGNNYIAAVYTSKDQFYFYSFTVLPGRSEKT